MSPTRDSDASIHHAGIPVKQLVRATACSLARSFIRSVIMLS
jgi:hypothetical protein